MNPTDSEDIAQLLEDAATHLEDVGLNQFSSIDEDQEEAGTPAEECRVCALGALAFVISGEVNADLNATQAGQFNAAEDAARRYLGQDLHHYNDEPDRTVEEVADAMRGAAKLLRAAALTPGN